MDITALNGVYTIDSVKLNHAIVKIRVNDQRKSTRDSTLELSRQKTTGI